MIVRINKIKNLGLVFCDYAWDAALPVFQKFNLIYGWNGCGKTTLARLFDAIGGTTIEDLEYEIEDGQGVKYKQQDAFPQKIRVFNQDYVQNNVKLLESRTNSISISLGKENKELVEKIESDKKILQGDPADLKKPGKIALRAKLVEDIEKKTSARNGKFTDIAKTIGAAIGGNALRDYRKPQAEKDFAGLAAKSELSDDDLKKYSFSTKQDSLPVIDLISQNITLSSDGGEFNIVVFFKSASDEAESLLLKTVESETISRLASNGDIAAWVEQGIHLHKKHSSKNCEYCLQKLPVARVEQLAKHFNEADKKLKESVQSLITKLREIYPLIQMQATQLPDIARLYEEYRTDFERKREELATTRAELLKYILALIKELEDKKTKTTEGVNLKTIIDASLCSSRINELNQVISRHNQKTAAFDDVKKDAIKRLKVHYLSTIFDDVKSLDADVLKLGGDIQVLKNEISGIESIIIQNLAQISSKHKACELINEKLTTFLGHQELTFVPQIDKEADSDGFEKEIVVGYQIMRGGKPAAHLSESEKTAIAFVYFVVHLGDQDFQVSDGIVVIDDPISSFDSNSLYQAFSFLKNAVKDARQVFIFTHNFDFLKLVINWRRHGGGSGYYMIKNHFDGDVRCARLEKMDKELCEYESEYHYLFKLLKMMRADQDGSIAKAYPIPNVARKVWDTFLMFSVPNGKTNYKKMEELKAAGHDEQKLDAIYKFTNDQSHITGAGFNPALVPETKKVVKELLEMMDAIAPQHFKAIDTATN